MNITDCIYGESHEYASVEINYKNKLCIASIEYIEGAVMEILDLATG